MMAFNNSSQRILSYRSRNNGNNVCDIPTRIIPNNGSLTYTLLVKSQVHYQIINNTWDYTCRYYIRIIKKLPDQVISNLLVRSKQLMLQIIQGKTFTSINNHRIMIPKQATSAIWAAACRRRMTGVG